MFVAHGADVATKTLPCPSGSRLLRAIGVLLLALVVGCGSTFPGEWSLDGTDAGGVGNAGSSSGWPAAGSGVVSGTGGSAGIRGAAGSGSSRAGVGGSVSGRGGVAGVGPVAGQIARPRDSDGDGFGVTDCNDFDASIFPGADDPCCDGVDSNCDGQDGFGSCSCYMFVDWDGDGYPSDVQGPKWDCDDRDPNIHPFNKELCNDGRDNDCNGAADRQDKACVPDSANGRDDDGDGYTILIDCNDFDIAVHPGAPEVCGDGLDNDCDGVVDPCMSMQDSDGDGFPQIKDCNDWDARIYPGSSAETCCDSTDSDCDGTDGRAGLKCDCFDADGDGYVVGPVAGDLVDCNDRDRSMHPGAPEICTDGIDNDCDGRIDVNDGECYVYVL
jgi:hypothetical protein